MKLMWISLRRFNAYSKGIAFLKIPMTRVYKQCASSMMATVIKIIAENTISIVGGKC